MMGSTFILNVLPFYMACLESSARKFVMAGYLIKLESTKNDCHMIKISELKEGDFVMVNNEGTQMEGEVLEVDNVQHMALLETNGQQDFWYPGEDLSPIPLNDAALKKINFQR